MNIRMLRAFLRAGFHAFICGAFTAAVLVAQEDNPGKHEEALPLPPWPKEDTHALQAERSLWPEDFDPNEVIHSATTVLPEAKPTEDEVWSRFLPRGLFSGASAPKPAAVSGPLVEMPSDAWHACEEMPADTRLFDPQGLLSEIQAEDMRRLLSFHSGRAGVSAALVLVDARQKLPAGADLTHLAGGALARVPACIVVYPLGEPGRARVFFTQIVARTAEPSYLENLASTCIRESSENTDPVEQVQRFAIQLSIRLFWLERAYPSLQPAAATPPALPVPVPVPVPPPAKPEPTAAVSVTQEQPPLSEVTPFQTTPSLWSRMTASISQNKNAVYLGIGALVLAGLIAVGIVLLVRWRRRRLRQCVWILPDFPGPTAPRFGGPHCGASGAFIQYG